MAYFTGSRSISPSDKKRYRLLMTEHLFREKTFGGETGFAIAGFGKQDIFPRLRAFQFSCAAFGLKKIRQNESADISRERIAVIQPFAQRDVMDSFIFGKDPVYDLSMQKFIGNFFAEKENQLRMSNPRKLKEATIVKSIGEELRTEFAQKMNDLAQESFVQPLMGVVASMPKEELATLAESLINLTSLKRKASRETETVGGPTDVAVISKGDGFIWIKRKHYFDPKFNPQFAVNYLEGESS